MSEQWATKYIGIPWNENGDSVEEGFNCWTFFRYIQNEEFGRKLPELNFFYSGSIQEANRLVKFAEPLFRIGWVVREWTMTENPVAGDGVLLGTNKREIHVGVWTGDSVLHCLEELGVVQTRHSEYKLQALRIRRFFTPRKDS